MEYEARPQRSRAELRRRRKRRARRRVIRRIIFVLICLIPIALVLLLFRFLSSSSEEPAYIASTEPEVLLEPWERFQPHSLPETDPRTNLGFQWDTDITHELGAIHFGMPEDYARLAGITTFRGNNFRNSAAWGTADITEERLVVRYEIGIGQTRRTADEGGSGQELWTGTGWPGQPVIVQWDMEVQQMMNLYPHMREQEGLIEVIQAAMDGYIHFFDLETGQATRDRISLNGEPMKGGAVIDPRGYPLLYVGQGDLMTGGRFGYYIFSLIDGSELFFLDGDDPFAPRDWPAFDSNPLIDAANDRMILCGENGIVYNILLNTLFDRTAGTISIDPFISRYRFVTNPHREIYGIENSPAAFGHHLFFADNSGLIQCVDMQTLEPVWVFDGGDDTDATLVLDWEEAHDRLVIYTGTSVDLQGSGGYAFIRKLDAANGGVLWEHSYFCQYNPNVNGGVMGTPVLGMGDISDLVIFSIAKPIGVGGDNLLIAFDRESGEIVWELVTRYYAWSSPVAVYTPDGRSYIVLADQQGHMHLIRGISGEIVYSLRLYGTIEASPAVFGNRIVIGTRWQRIFGIEIL